MAHRDTGLDQAAAGSLKTDTGQPGSKSDEQENEACCGDSMSLDMGVVSDFPKKPRSGVLTWPSRPDTCWK